LNTTSTFESVSSAVTGTAVSAAAGKGSQTGTYQISVSQLARSYSVATAGIADRDANLGAGEVTINLANGDSMSLSLDAASSSLEDLRDAINEKDAGVNASIVNDGGASPYRLALSSSTTGEEAAISSVDFGALGVELALDSATEVLAQNAQFNVNGVGIISQTNQVEGAIEGMTLSLAEEGEATVRVNTDSKAIEGAIEKFVSAYNQLQEQIGKLSSYNQETGEAGNLLGDSTLRSVESRLRSVFVAGVAEGDFQRLSDVGISLQLDGTLEVDSEVISDLVSNDLSAVAKFFAASATEDGLAGKLDGVLENMLRDTGLLDNAKTGLDSRIESLDDRYDRMQLTIDRTVDRYRAQFASLDGLVANMNSTSAYISQQFDILNAQLSS
jgi:flagellar hook-associated protein 2